MRRANLYGPGRDVTPYHMTVEDNVAPELIAELAASAGYAARRAAVEAFNASHNVLKKGLALTPVKFGISFTTTHLNQAGALVLVYADGSIQLNHGGTEMGQGLMIKVAQVVADVFARADRDGEDHRDAHRQGAQHLGHRRLLGRGPERHGRAERRRDDQGSGSTPSPRRSRGSSELELRASSAAAPISARISLSATGFYATPKIHYDRATHTRPALPLFRLWRGAERGRDRHADRRAQGAARSTSSTTSAARSIRRSTSARSRAASSRAWAG